MKTFTSTLIQQIKPTVVALAVITSTARLFADPIPYPAPFGINPVTYTFTAAASGDITAYFAGSTASYDNELGLLVNGVSTGIVGLDNHTTALGTSLDLGSVHAGDVLTFVLVNHTLGMNAYSDPSMNASYDMPGYTGSHNHVYSTPYTASSPVIDGIPAGTFVSFEDLRFPNSDFNYNDEDFVFANVGVSQGVPDCGSTAGLLGFGFAGLALLRRRFCA
jgi:VPDSG-CTERM motif